MSTRLRKRPAPPGPVRLLRLKIEVEYAKPAIWRRVELPAGMHLIDVHVVLQILMGWHESHLWQFEQGGRLYADPEFDLDMGLDMGATPTADASKVLIGEVLTAKGGVLRYNYDFGDAVPSCLAGERAGPPEDCGGPGGLENLLDVYAKPRKNRDDLELLEWVGEEWDPDAFDIEMLNAALDAVFKPRRRRQNSREAR